jgi:hypothetical protein
VGDRFADWTRDKDGNLSVCPFMGYQTAIFAGMGCAVRLEFIRTPDQIGKSGESVQLAMTPPQAKELGEALMKMANRIDLTTPPGAQRS